MNEVMKDVKHYLKTLYVALEGGQKFRQANPSLSHWKCLIVHPRRRNGYFLCRVSVDIRINTSALFIGLL